MNQSVFHGMSGQGFKRCLCSFSAGKQLNILSEEKRHEQPIHAIFKRIGEQKEHVARRAGSKFVFFFCVSCFIRDHSIFHLGGIKQCKCIVILRDFPHNSALFGLVI